MFFISQCTKSLTQSCVSQIGEPWPLFFCNQLYNALEQGRTAPFSTSKKQFTYILVELVWVLKSIIFSVILHLIKMCYLVYVKSNCVCRLLVFFWHLFFTDWKSSFILVIPRFPESTRSDWNVLFTTLRLFENHLRCCRPNCVTNCGFTLLSQSTTAVFTLPPTANASESECDTTSSLLKLTFGKGNSWSMKFNLTGQTYQADSIVFSYDLSDASLFPKAKAGNSTPDKTKPGKTSQWH